ncbi:MAG: hypothetical protein ACOYBU_09800 [Dermatophilaceae bacterium]
MIEASWLGAACLRACGNPLNATTAASSIARRTNRGALGKPVGLASEPAFALISAGVGANLSSLT